MPVCPTSYDSRPRLRELVQLEFQLDRDLHSHQALARGLSSFFARHKPSFRLKP